jgi:hypothetical protein
MTLMLQQALDRSCIECCSENIYNMNKLKLSKIMIVFKYVMIKLKYYDYNMPHTIF